MKKAFFLLLVFPMIFVSCSKSGSPDDVDQRILNTDWEIPFSSAIPYFDIRLLSDGTWSEITSTSTGTWTSKNSGGVIETSESTSVPGFGSFNTKVTYTITDVTDTSWTADYSVRINGTNTANGTAVMTPL